MRTEIGIVLAEGSGDDAIVAEATRLVAEGRTVIVVTSDRGLRSRAEESDARTESVGWLLRQLDGEESEGRV